MKYSKSIIWTNMKKYTPQELKNILAEHQKWLNDPKTGSRAYLYGAYLYGADLRSANLYGADLRGANLYSANLVGVNLREANWEYIYVYDNKGNYKQLFKTKYVQAENQKLMGLWVE